VLHLSLLYCHMATVYIGSSNTNGQTTAVRQLSLEMRQ
jgi:hypothetical protein